MRPFILAAAAVGAEGVRASVLLLLKVGRMILLFSRVADALPADSW